MARPRNQNADPEPLQHSLLPGIADRGGALRTRGGKGAAQRTRGRRRGLAIRVAGKDDDGAWVEQRRQEVAVHVANPGS